MANDKDFLLKNAVEVGKDIKVTLGSITSSDIDLATGNYFADTLAANTTYTISNAGDVQSFQLEVTGGALGYGLNNANYDSKSFSVAGQDTNPTGLAFKADGTKVYIAGNGTDSVYQYSLSTAWDISTASYDSVSFSLSSQDTSPSGPTFKPDGTSFYIVGSIGTRVYQYTLSTAWDLSTASYASKSFLYSSQEGGMEHVRLKTDGTKMYLIGADTDAVYQYSLSTAWDVSTASYDSVSFSVASEELSSRTFDFNSDGSSFFIVGDTNSTVYQYDLSTAWDLSTASYSGVSFSVSAQETTPRALSFGNSGTKMYTAGSTNDTIYQYSTISAALVTWPSSIEWAGGVAPSAPATGETDVFTFVTDDGGTSYVGLKTADNLS